LPLGLRVDREPERVLRVRRLLLGRLDLGEDLLGLLDPLEGPGLLHMTQARAQTVEELAEGALRGQVCIPIALTRDQGTADGLGREARVSARG
jgi:hypothetical protein